MSGKRVLDRLSMLKSDYRANGQNHEAGRLMFHDLRQLLRDLGTNPTKHFHIIQTWLVELGLPEIEAIRFIAMWA